MPTPATLPAAGARPKASSGVRCRPARKTRIAPLPAESFTGYPLLAAVAGRIAAARAEHHRGMNDQALLFPARGGKLWWHSSFDSDVLLPAMCAAGWPLREWTKVHDVRKPRLRRYVRPGRAPSPF